MSICLDFVLLGSSPGELGDEGNGERKGDCIGLFRRLELFRVAMHHVSPPYITLGRERDGLSPLLSFIRLTKAQEIWR